jgi:outer membrane protein
VPRELSLEEAIATAHANNPGFQVTRNDEELASQDVRSALGGLLPTASVSSGMAWQGAGEQRFGTLTAEQLGFRNQPSYYSSSYSLGMSYTLSGSTLLAPRQARAAREATEARIETGGANLALQITQTYLEVLRQDEALNVVRRELERAEYNLRLAEGQLEVGSATPLDVKQAEVAVGRARVTVLRTENAGRTARIRLLVGMGLDPDPDVRLTTRFEVTEPLWTEGELVALALERNPALDALRASLRANDVAVRAARSRFLPSLSLSAGISGFTQRASSTGFLIAQAEGQSEAQIQQCQFQNDLYSRLADPLPPMNCGLLQLSDADRQGISDRNSYFPFDFTGQPPQLSLTVSLPLFSGFSRSRQLQSARVEQENVRHRVREQELGLRAEISAGLSAVRTAWRTAEIEEQNSAVADDQLRLAREQYAVGSASFLQLVEAETLKAQADRDRIGSVHTYHETLADLEAVVGVSLRSSRDGSR